VPGRISARHVNLGDFVEPGTVMLEIDPKDLEENVRIAFAGLESAKTRASQAKKDFERHEILHRYSAVSKAAFEQYKTAHEAAGEALRQAGAQYNRSRNALGYSKLAAADGGVISSLEAEVGQVVAAGQPVLTFVRSGELEVEISIPEHKIFSMSLNQPVAVKFWAFPELTCRGFIREISPVADVVTRTYRARVSLPVPPPEVQLGMTASVEAAQVSAAAGRKVALVPVAAIFQTGGQPGVWLVKDGRVRLSSVTVGEFNENRVEVTSGLAEGDVLVVAGVHKLHEGQSVRVRAFHE
jgi:RND family efflux transporter MFP subunit